MRNFLLTILLCLSAYVIAGNGTQASPLTVAEAKSKSLSSTTKYWVTGYVVGEMNSYANGKWFFNVAPPFSGGVYLIADSPEEYVLTQCLCLQFPTSSNGIDFNLYDSPQYWRKKVLFQATREDYNNMAGLKKVTDFSVLTPEPLADEAQAWDFFETFEDGEFTPTDATDKWLGGEFEVREYYGKSDKIGTVVCTWKLINAIIDDGKPKWDDQCASLRNQNASLELTFDREEGIGEVEFWAGNYEDYKTAQLTFTLAVSADKGKTWKTVAADQQVAKSAKSITNGMTLYRYKVNTQGQARIRITKTDTNNGKGLQIDDIKMSRYTNTGTALDNAVFPATIKQQGQQLVIQTPVPQQLTIYNALGQTVADVLVNGEYTITLHSGVYILRTPASARKVLVK